MKTCSGISTTRTNFLCTNNYDFTPTFLKKFLMLYLMRNLEKTFHNKRIWPRFCDFAILYHSTSMEALQSLGLIKVGDTFPNFKAFQSFCSLDQVSVQVFPRGDFKDVAVHRYLAKPRQELFHQKTSSVWLWHPSACNWSTGFHHHASAAADILGHDIWCWPFGEERVRHG